MTFEQLFTQATQIQEGPFPFQRRFAASDHLPSLVQIPTGLGKTAMAILGWVWRRRFAEASIRNTTPRRLIYCLPMRTLVEQTYQQTLQWLARLRLLAGSYETDDQGQLKPETYQPTLSDSEPPDRIAVYLLMGGEEPRDWDLYPERDAILIGTQDMLLSRALNRGYGMSRYRWPMHFGLLHNDCLWIFDEVQLMDVGTATSAQLEAFRRIFGTLQPVHCIWMSATLAPSWLHTVDFDPSWLGEPLQLQDADLKHPQIAQRYSALKPIQRAPAVMGEEKKIAETILQEHRPASLTLAIFNTVDRAQKVYEQLKAQLQKAKKKNPNDAFPQLVLIHSRFRPEDRAAKIKQLLSPPTNGGTIAITTQVVEAGIDVSAKTLFTELAPWASLVQRFGRCNRYGEHKDARIFWFDISPDTNSSDPKLSEKLLAKLAPPYSPHELIHARDLLLRGKEQRKEVSLRALHSIQNNFRLQAPHVLRRRDFIDLFDTTPDLAGNDIDISRFIRSGQDHDVQVFWRQLPEGETTPDPNRPDGVAPRRDELCPVPFHELRDFVSKHSGQVWRWDYLERAWIRVRPDDIYPGQTYLIHSKAGGYTQETGWDPKSEVPVQTTPPSETEEEGIEEEAYDTDPTVLTSTCQTIAEHADQTVQVLQEILSSLSLPSELQQALETAARWHDRGKAHPVFQNAIRELLDQLPTLPDACQRAAAKGLLAKVPNPKHLNSNSFRIHYDRPHFRHELASALALLQTPPAPNIPAWLHDLAAYLVAAHHGKVRLSIRSLPGETPPSDDPSRLFARGIYDQDTLPETDLGNGQTAPAQTLSLDCMQLGRSPDGQPSWIERMLKLRDDHLGPFRLAYLEALLRAADARASRRTQTTTS